ncbi:conjugal transfer protein [Jiangella alkaliphila]|uniref:Conjugative transposon protein TcpC n=1 Tax=Jiangella alkaliphila TaxID=419479 RepID=A0A1H2HKS3_9ACTN|nr:conjugal transfer protein [Jiangella alkaliphila]SDU32382.1 Conjugative transposon protein TcpC [Jiangella alkaliphila]
MKTNWGFGPPKEPKEPKGTDGEGPRDTAAADTARSEQHTWTGGSQLATRVVVGLLWAALIAGPLALALQVLLPENRPVVRQDGYVDRIGEAAAVSEFAERAVVAWLETPAERSDALRAYFGDLGLSRADVPWTTSGSAVAEIVKDDSGLWSVTVGVDAAEGKPPADAEPAAEPAEDTAETPAETPAEDDANAEDDAGEGEDGEAEPVQRITAGRLYFQVPVLYVDGEMIAQALPSPVPAPDEFDQLASAYDHGLASDHPAFARVANFLSAMLVSGDQASLEAYSSPGTSFRVLNPVPYAGVQVETIVAAGGDAPSEEPSDGETAEVQANVTLSGSNGEELGAQYALVLQAREGRWEVAQLRTSPALAEPVPLPEPVPVTPTPTPGTSTSQGTSSQGPSQTPSDEPTREAGSDPPTGSTTESP